MTKDPAKQSVAYLRRKADRLLQELGRKVYDLCIVCGKPMDCLHHYHTKSSCAALRYEWSNLIPICTGCHNRHHNGDPLIHNQIDRVRGRQWVDELEMMRREKKVKTNKGYYREIIKALEEALDHLDD